MSTPLAALLAVRRLLAYLCYGVYPMHDRFPTKYLGRYPLNTKPKRMTTVAAPTPTQHGGRR